MFKIALNLAKNLTTVAKTTNKMSKGKSLPNVVKVLEDFAPTSTAEAWDNVGLLIEPYKQRDIENILLTNDLTENVMQEALQKNINLIISYHPLIFTPLRRITQSHWKQRIVSMCLSESIALYSPHTAWDVVAGGVNDWLASALPSTDLRPIMPNATLNGGLGRYFNTSVTLQQAIDSVQKLIGLDVHVAMGVQHTLNTPIKSAAVCAGSGNSVLKDVRADLYITGEMSHHELLEANHNNITVILCNHSNSERGFLTQFKTKLDAMLENACNIVVSQVDADPLKTFPKA